MTSLKKITCGVFLTLIFSVVFNNHILAQDSQEDPLNHGTLQEQFEHVHSRTRIYEGFRAIRDDMFQKVRRNSLDSLNKAKRETQLHINQLVQTKASMDSLSAQLQLIMSERDQAIKEKDNLYLLGIPVNKSFYNVLLWSIIGGLLILTSIMFVLFQRSNRITKQTSREMNDTLEEFDEYRKNSRERFEKQSIEHFNELRKLKGI